MNHQPVYPSQDLPTSSYSSVDAWALRHSALPPRLEHPPREPPGEPPETDAQTCGSDLDASSGWPAWPPAALLNLPPTVLPIPATVGAGCAGISPSVEVAAHAVRAVVAADVVVPFRVDVLGALLPDRSAGSNVGYGAASWNRWDVVAGPVSIGSVVGRRG